MILNAHYPYIGGGKKATIVVSAPTGSTVTATLGTTVLRTTEKNGVWTFNVRAFGVWTINATLGNESAQTTVNVTQETTYNVSLSYAKPSNGIIIDGDTVFVDYSGKLIYDETRKRWYVPAGKSAYLNGIVFSSNTTTLYIDTPSSGLDVYIDDTLVGKSSTGEVQMSIPSALLPGTHVIKLRNTLASRVGALRKLWFNI